MHTTMACPDVWATVLLAGTQVLAFVLGTCFGFAVAAWAARRQPIEDTTSCSEQPPQPEDSAAPITEWHDINTEQEGSVPAPITGCRHDNVTRAGSNQFVAKRQCLDCGRRWSEDTPLNVRRKALNER